LRVQRGDVLAHRSARVVADERNVLQAESLAQFGYEAGAPWRNPATGLASTSSELASAHCMSSMMRATGPALKVSLDCRAYTPANRHAIAARNQINVWSERMDEGQVG
jgi:hypothetical protein